MVRRSKYFLILILSLLLLFISLRDSFIIVKGGSMEPSLYHNDFLITYPKAPNEIEIGEIVVISSARYYIENGGAPQFSAFNNNTKIIHRVINKKEINGTWFFLTKGDNNILIDGSIICINRSQNYSLFEYNASEGVYIPEIAIESVMLFKIPLLGYVQDFALLILMGVGFFFLFFYLKKKKSNIFRLKSQEIVLKTLNRINLFLYFSFILFLSIIIFIHMNNDIFYMNNNTLAPIFYEDDLLVRENVAPEMILVNDIVIIESPKYFYEQGFDPIFWDFYPNSSYIIHRVIEKKKVNNTWFFITQGDQSPWKPDGNFKTIEKIGNYDYFKFELNETNKVFINQEAIIGVIKFKIPILSIISKNSILIFSTYTLLISVISLKIKLMKRRTLKT
ncbi:MAG: signal peptidase I [Promethearchaeota archaeon]|nr:MAG: signal peptidase I [Candidatus Lokiarchaeota archaeon]